MAIRVIDEFGSRANPPDSAYPDGSLKNETNPGVSDDGSPLEARVGNDWEGFKQSVIYEAGISANGQPDNVENPQILSAVKSITDNRFNADGVVYTGLGNISDVAEQQLAEVNKLNAYQFPDGSRLFYGAKQNQSFPITIPADPSSDNGWSLVGSLTGDWGGVAIGTQVKHRRGVDAEIMAGTPAIGELWFNTDDNTIHMGDGVTQGGIKQRTHRTPSDFGAVVGQDSTSAVIAWLKSGELLALDDSYTISVINESINDIRVIDLGGELVSSTVSAGAPIVKITGNNNKMLGFNLRHTNDMRSFQTLLWLEGTKNRAEGCDTSCDIAYEPVSGEQYVKAGIVLIGDSNSAVRNTGVNVGTGIIEDGWHNWIQGNNYTAVCAGIKMQAGSRHAHILDNTIDGQLKGQGLQGCDGIWGERSHRFSTIRGNVVKNMGEHGGYLQGDGFTWDKSNWVEGCHGALLKVGAKTSGNVAHPGETLPTFDEYGQPSIAVDAVYATNDATIEPRGKNCGIGGSTSGVVSLQTNIAQLTIVNYDITDCDNAPNAIRSLYLESEPAENQKVMAQINLLAGRVRRAGNVSFAGRSGMVIDGLNTDSDISITAKTGEINISPEVSVRRAGIITLSRTSGPVLISCNAVAVNEATSTDAELIDCRLSDQSQGGGWTTARVKAINGGKITWLGNTQFEINGVSDCTNVTFNIPDYTGSYALAYRFGQGNPTEGSFNGNIINAELSERPVRIGGDYSAVNSNTINGAASSNFSMTIQGEKVTAVGNAIRYGDLRLETTSANCFVVGPNVSDGGTTNTVISS